VHLQPAAIDHVGHAAFDPYEAVFVDASASMACGGAGITKLEYAGLLMAALAYLVLRPILA